MFRMGGNFTEIPFSAEWVRRARGFPVSMHSLKRRGRMAAIAVTIGLIAASCGSDPDPIEASAAESQPATEESTTGPDSEDATGDSAAEADGTEADPELEGPAVVGDHLFPDLSTVNIADGSTVNLAQHLAGGDTPVMLWFFAPH